MEGMVRAEDRITARIQYFLQRVNAGKEADYYFFNQPIEELRGGTRVYTGGREMLMFASYSYLGLIGHPKINAAARAAVDKYGTGTHGVRMLAGSLDLHEALEAAIADFKHTEAAITFSSGYVTNLTAVSTLVGRHDVVICDKLNHASIVDGCLLSGADFVRFRHNDMADLERCLQRVEAQATKLVVVDAVFSMDGDIMDLPRTAELCRKYGAWLMVDEAHSIGVLGRTGRGVEEHFGMENAIDLKMGTLSKTIPSIGGYLAGRHDLIHLFRHASRAYIFSAALPPAQAAAAKAAFEIILEEPERVENLRRNAAYFRDGLKQLGFDTMNTETAIVPVLCGPDESAYEMTRYCQRDGIFVLPVVSPAVPEGLARLRASVTAAHQPEEIDRALSVFEKAGKKAGII
ncbi:MAG TPA: aminotransferase class I/II-fold pyridoxal phosphate-dependent enzyme [Anaerolineales bacterium]|nr:aminotransferase class I/II-fold pyridoxal phosphate-dependent enzyme [Anaerolineales bacterium]